MATGPVRTAFIANKLGQTAADMAALAEMAADFNNLVQLVDTPNKKDEIEIRTPRGPVGVWVLKNVMANKCLSKGNARIQ